MMWKKRKTKISVLLSSLLALCIVLFSVLSATAVDNNNVQEPEQSGDAALDVIFDKQRDASEANENIDEFLRCVPNSRTNRATNYPDYYAGSYIDDDGKLAVMLTDNSPEIRQALTDAAGNSAVRFESATYSYEELTQMANVIYEKMKENQLSKKDGTHQPNICDDIRYAMLLDDQNVISVNIHGLTEEKIQSFKNEILDSSAIVFENTNDSFQYLAGTAPGQKIQNNWYTFSAAFRVHRYTTSGEESGFLTCAHANNNVNTVIQSASGSRMGTVQLRRIGGAYDLAYVKLDSGSAMTNIINNTYYTLTGDNDHIATPTLNKFVVLYGATSGSTSGYIKSTNYIGAGADGVAFSGLIAASFNSQSGDSGGLICSDKNGYGFNTMGILCGKTSQYSVFTSAIKAVNLWYLTRY